MKSLKKIATARLLVIILLLAVCMAGCAAPAEPNSGVPSETDAPAESDGSGAPADAPQALTLPILDEIDADVAVGTAGSSLLAVPLGVLTAVYLTEIAHPAVRRVVKPFVELLAALPSVVLGFLGMVVLAPFLQDALGAASGLNLLNASLVLALMSVPTICSVSEDALYSVPRDLREASLALGATRWQTTVRVVVPAALSGIGTAVMLGMSRAIGETMVVLMVAGGAAILPTSLLDPVRPMPASIAAEMAEAPFRSEHYHALFAIVNMNRIFQQRKY